jgi:peptidyl-prolyl cis-trans isomerase D
VGAIHNMSSIGKTTLLAGLCCVTIIYLAGDLCLWHGPLRRQLERATPRDRQVVARVCNFPITRSQLERAVRERLWLEGKAIESLTPDKRKSVRAAALDDLIDHQLLRVKAMANASQLTVSDAEIDGCLLRFGGRFESQDAMASAMKSQGIASERALRARLAARIQQEKYVESRIGPIARVSDTQAQQWFDANRRHLTIPERVEARHIFIPTLECPPDEAKAKLEAALADLTANHKDFATLARELSEDPATKDHGGSLGWMTRGRLPADFATPVFQLALNRPTLVRTRLGWHLVEVTGRMPAEPQTFEQAKPEILAALEAVNRRQAVTEFRAALRRSEAPNIEVFHDTLAEPD